MLEVFSYVHDAVMEVQNIQQQPGNDYVLTGFGSALGSSIEGVGK